MPSIFDRAISTSSDSTSSERAIVIISAFSPNAIGSSFALLKTPDSKVSIVSFIFVLTSSREVSMLSGIILNCIPAVAISRDLRIRIYIYILLIGLCIFHIFLFLFRILGMEILLFLLFLCHSLCISYLDVLILVYKSCVGVAVLNVRDTVRFRDVVYLNNT